MTLAIVKKSTIAVKLEDIAYATAPTVPIASTDVIRVEGFQIDPEYNLVKQNEIINTKDELPEIRTYQTAPGNISINMRGCGTPGTAPEGSVLYECAIGVKNASTQTVCGTGSTTTSIVLASGGGAGFAVKDCIAVICPTATTFTVDTGPSTTSIPVTATVAGSLRVGDVIQVPNAAGASLIEATQITAIDATNKILTVSPALTAAPTAGQSIAKATIGITWITVIATDTLTVSPAVAYAPVAKSRVRAGTHYKLTLNELKSFYMSMWRGDLQKEDYSGFKVDSMELDISTGAIVVPKFTVKGQSQVSIDTGAYALGAPTFNSDTPMVGVSQTITIAGSSVRCEKFGIKLTNTILDRMDVTTPGMSDRIQTSRKLEGSFDVLMEDSAILTAMKNDTLMEAVCIIGKLGLMPGKVWAMRIPQLRYVKVPITDKSGVFSYGVSWVAVQTLGEDTLYSLSCL